jgi:hypothetical protein
MAALGNAQSAVASLATAVDARAQVATVEQDVANLRAELAKSRDDTEQERKAYRRGYLIGRSHVQRGVPDPGEDELLARRRHRQAS